MQFAGDTGSNYDDNVYQTDSGGSGAILDHSVAFMSLHNQTAATFGIVANGCAHLFAHIFAKSGVKRRMIGRIAYDRAGDATAPLTQDQFTGTWKDTSTNLTSITIKSSAGNIGGTGTFIRVYKVLD